MVFKLDTPAFVTDFFHKDVWDNRLPKFLKEMNLQESKKQNLIIPDSLQVTYGAKTYTNNLPNNKYYLNFAQEYDLDTYILSIYPFVVFLAGFAEDANIAGYITEEFGTASIFSFKDGLAHWMQDITIPLMAKDGKLDYYELLALGTKIKYAQGTEEEINNWMNAFDKTVPYPNGSSLFFYPENYKHNSEEVSNYNPKVEEVVEKCLSYKPKI